MSAKYPNLIVNLAGCDNDTFAVFARVYGSLRRNAGDMAAFEFANHAVDYRSYDDLLHLTTTFVKVATW